MDRTVRHCLPHAPGNHACFRNARAISPAQLHCYRHSFNRASLTEIRRAGYAARPRDMVTKSWPRFPDPGEKRRLSGSVNK
jgi:hypothetical protein